MLRRPRHRISARHDAVADAHAVRRGVQHRGHAIFDTHLVCADQRRAVQRPLEDGGLDTEGVLEVDTPVDEDRSRLQFH